MLITQEAQRKISQLSEAGKPFRVRATGSLNAGALIDLIPTSDIEPSDSRIVIEPLIVADIGTVLLVCDRQIDYDDTTESFVISKRG